MRGHRFSYAANISIMFGEDELLHRPAAARAAGFTMIELWWPFPDPVANDDDVDQLVGAIDDAGVRLIGLNFFAGDMPAGQRGVACRPTDRSKLEANAEQVVEIARRTGCRKFNLLYGQLDDRWTVAEQSTAARDAIAAAAEAVAAIDGTVLLEPLTRGANGAYPLTTAGEVVQVINDVAAPNVGLLFDLFHLGGNGADLITEAGRYGDRIRHVQVADHPGRGEPGTGTLPIAGTLESLSSSYADVVACEYQPTVRTERSLDWIGRVDAP